MIIHDYTVGQSGSRLSQGFPKRLCLLEICLASLVQSSNSSSLASEHKEKTAEQDWHGMGSLWFLRLWMHLSYCVSLIDLLVVLRAFSRSRVETWHFHHRKHLTFQAQWLTITAVPFEQSSMSWRNSSRIQGEQTWTSCKPGNWTFKDI